MNKFITSKEVLGRKGAMKKKKRFRSAPKDKKTGIPKKYLSGAKNRSEKASEIKETARRYRLGLPIDVKKVSESRTAQGKKKNARKTKK